MKLLAITAITASVVLCGTAGAQSTPTIAAHDLGTLGGNYSQAAALNDRGNVVGGSTTATGVVHAFLWTPATGMEDLGTLGGPFSTATAINDYGVIVGYSTVNDGDDTYHAFAWLPQRGMVDLGPGQAFDVNNRGQIVGVDPQGAVMWRPGRRTIRLVDVTGPFSDADGLNEFSIAVGSLMNDGYVTKVFGTRAIALAAIRGCAPADINNIRAVAGYDRDAGPRAFLWTAAGGLEHLQSLGGSYSQASAINDFGHIVGWSDRLGASGVRAALWRSTLEPIDLGTLGASNWAQATADDLNHRGQIAGGSQTSLGEWHATLWEVRLTPAEEIESLTALLRKLFATGTLRRADYRTMQRLVERASHDLQAADFAGARRALRTLAHRLDALARRGRTPTVFVEVIRDALTSAIVHAVPRPAVRIGQLP